MGLAAAMKTDEIEYTHDAPTPAEPLLAQQHRVLVTATHRQSGETVSGAEKVLLFSSRYWRERNRLHDELEKRIKSK